MKLEKKVGEARQEEGTGKEKKEEKKEGGMAEEEEDESDGGSHMSPARWFRRIGGRGGVNIVK